MSAKSGSGKTDKGTFRARHTLDLKLKVLQLLGQGVIHNTIAGRYKFGLRTVSRVRDERRPLCHAGAGSKPKTLAAGDGGYAHVSPKGKCVSDGSNDPAVEELGKTLNKLSSRVRRGDEQGSPVTDTAMVNMLANLNIIPKRCADEAAIEAAQVWVTVEDQEDVFEAMRLDAAEELTEQLEGTLAWGAWTQLMTRRRTVTMR